MSKELSGEGKLSRRSFLFSALSAAPLFLGRGEQAQNSTQAAYAQQNLEQLLLLLENPPTETPNFGLVTDPTKPTSEILRRFEVVTAQVGRADRIGIFTQINDLETDEQQHLFLKQLTEISLRLRNVKPQIALGCSNTPNEQHLFAPSNEVWLKERFQSVADILKKFNRPVEIRFLYEMNTLHFNYSRGQFTISDKDQVEGFKKAAFLFDYILKKTGIRDAVTLIFNPTAWQDFSQYSLDFFDEVALDVYDMSYLKGVLLGSWWFPPGKLTPQQVIDGPVKKLISVACGKTISFGELGSFSNDISWLLSFVLCAAVNDVTKITPFDVDKSQYETNFQLSTEMSFMYKNVLDLVALTRETPSSERTSELLRITQLLNIPLQRRHLKGK